MDINNCRFSKSGFKIGTLNGVPYPQFTPFVKIANSSFRNTGKFIYGYGEAIYPPASYQNSVFAVIDLGDFHLMMEADTAGKGAKGATACYYRFENIKPKSKQEYETNKADLLATLLQIKKPQTEKRRIQGKW